MAASAGSGMKSFSCSNHVQPDSRDKEYTNGQLQLLVFPSLAQIYLIDLRSECKSQMQAVHLFLPYLYISFLYNLRHTPKIVLCGRKLILNKDTF